MTKLIHPLRGLLNRAQRRFIGSRPGSVLILVIALLVLLALIGTAYMTMAQGDRAAAQQHTFNTEVDLLLQGVKNLVKGTLVGDLFVNGQFRPANGYNSWNSLGLDSQTIQQLQKQSGKTIGSVPGDAWLAPRLPEPLHPEQVPNADQMSAAGNPPVWRFLTGPLNGTAQFDTPFWPSDSRGGYLPIHPIIRDSAILSSTGSLAVPFQIDGTFQPWFIPSIYTSAGVRVPDSNPVHGFLGADTDGDGIADSGMFKLVTLDGVTYYAAVRIIDNLSAVNASVAWAPVQQIPPATAYPAVIPGDFFPTSINLAGLVWPQDNTPRTGVNAMKLGAQYGNGVNVAQQVLPDGGGMRSDFRFSTFQEMAWEILGRRLGNPSPRYNCDALSLSESIAMAHGFCLAPTSPSSVLEKFLPASTTGAARGFTVPVPTSPYQPGDWPRWYSTNFYFANPTGTPIPIRTLLVSHNAVSNFCPNKFRIRSQNDQLGPILFGDVVMVDVNNPKNLKNNPNPYMRPFTCIDPSQAASVIPAVANTPGEPTIPFNWQPPRPADNGIWAFEPWKDAPTKISVNTGTFAQLWLAYWNVMTEANGQPMFTAPAVAANAKTVSYLGKMFRTPIRGSGGAGSTSGTGGGTSGGSGGGGPAPKPAPPPAFLASPQVAQLRAALAAVNTLALRDSSDTTNETIPSRTIYLGTNASGTYGAMVFGVKKQPYITEVYARNSVQAGAGTGEQTDNYVVIELYNPYPTPIKVTNWHVAALTRNISPMVFKDLGPIPDSTIDAKGYLILANSKTPPKGIKNDVAVTVVPNLKNAFGNEVLIFRPRRTFDGVPSKRKPLRGLPTYNDTYDETSNVDDMVPVDSYDFTNLVPGEGDANGKPKGSALPTEWFYIRPHDDAGKAWHFVYPGRWSPAVNPTAATGGAGGTGGGGTGSQTSGDPTVMPTRHDSVPPGAQDFPLSDTLNKPWSQPFRGSAKEEYRDVALQLDNIDFAGPNKVQQIANTNNPNRFPYGGFARNGDILEVTFIGSYKIFRVGDRHSIVEINPVTMDSTMAVAQNPGAGGTGMQPYAAAGNLAENIGRFCPIDARDPASNQVNDFAAPTSQGAANGTNANDNYAYRWAMKLFEYLTVQSPQDDYLPDVDPALKDDLQPGTNTPYTQPPPKDWNAGPNGHNHMYYPETGIDPVNGSSFAPEPVANKAANVRNALLDNPHGATEETAPVEGLINVNTAPWPVLKAVPFVPLITASGTPAPPPPPFKSLESAQQMIAQSIVYYRDVKDPKTNFPHGMFGSLFELNDVPIYATTAQLGGPATLYFRDLLGNVDTTPFKPEQGDFYQFVAGKGKTGASTGQVTGDFKGRFLMVNRVSSFLTTRSDSFTAYILVQGWQNAETDHPHLVVQRRAMLLIDRSTVTPLNKDPDITQINAE